MKVAAVGIADPIRATIQSWGWELTEIGADAILTEAAGQIEIRAAATLHADDIIFLPLKEEELKHRIEWAKRRQTRFARRLHDLRSPLTAIQGYAEIIAESAQGDPLRFASNIRTASELLTSRLENFREEGV
ncbi:MAG: histidine kinase dimerization/phospho-acceptor domain-containing protein [Bryobacteraceae bacterium]